MFGVQDIQERRVFPRIRFSEPVQFESPDSRVAGGSLSRDVSEGGIRIRLNEFMPLGSELLLQVSVAAEHVVECLGRVVWIEKIPFGENYQAGVSFDETTATNGARRLFRMIAAGK